MIQIFPDSRLKRIFRMFRICFRMMRKQVNVLKANVFEAAKSNFFAFRMVANLLIAKCYAVQH